METHDVTLRPGGAYRLEVGGSGSAGYGWSYEVTGPPSIVTVSLDAGAPPPPPPAGRPPMSYSVSYTLSVVAVRKGSAVVHLRLQRATERDKPPLREIEVRVAVEGDG